MTFVVTAAEGWGDRAAVRAWQVASSVDAGDDGAVISAAGYDAGGWLTAPPRSTVMAALLANGRYPDVFRSTNLRDAVDRSGFAVPWWYRTLFTTPGAGHVHVRLDGVIPRADVWVNGHRVAAAATTAGAYVVTTLDITQHLRPGLNGLALRVHPGNPMQDLSIGWVDWSQSPPDDNMGPWRDVVVGSTGPVRLGRPQVTTAFPGGDHRRARLSVAVEARNLSAREQRTVIAGAVTRHGEQRGFSLELTLGPDATETVEQVVTVEHPHLWWPIGEGEQAMYDLVVTAAVDGVHSDRAGTAFGVRTVDSDVRPGGGRQFRINGRPVQVVGGGWSPDLFLRHDPDRLSRQLALTTHLGLNAIRPEGKLENPEFYDLCDRLGVMVLPGWECCNKWEAHAGTGGETWSEADFDVAERSMESEAILLRNHPSVIGFLIGSDFAPPPDLARRYALALARAGWDLPVVASATVQGSEVTGPSGMKMTGPYDWVPPVYWYDRDPELGGAVGFNSETSAGHTVPRLPSLRRMLSPAELDRLWQQPELAQYHSGPPSVFDNLRIFAHALAERYGRPRSLEDFVGKAQLAAYEVTRAQFEAFTTRADDEQPATGVIYWMLSAPWPSLNWQLFDYDLDTPGSYTGARKALEPVHVLYAYDRRVVQVVNRTGADTGPLAVAMRTWCADGRAGGEQRHQLGALPPGAVADVAAAGPPEGAEGLWWLELELVEDGGAGRRSRNVYWLSTVDDELDRTTTTWHSTGVSRFADLRALDEGRAARVRVDAVTVRSGAELGVEVTLRNDDPSGTPAVALHPWVSVGGVPVAPVLWSDSDVTLFAGQAETVTGRLAVPSAGGPLQLHVDGFNLHRSAAVVLAAT